MMADVLPDPNNPAGEPPSADTTPSVEKDVLEIFDLGGDTSAEADAIAAGSPATPAPAAAPAAPVPGAEATAPSAPVTSPESSTTPSPATPEPSTGKPPAAPAAAPAPTEPPAAAPTPQPGLVDERALKEASLTAQVDALQRERDQLLANQRSGAPTPGAAPGSDQPSAEPPPIRYGLTIPEAVQADILSDDPAKNIGAIQRIVNDLGTIVHNNVLTQVRTEVRAAFSSLNSMADSLGASETQATARETAKAEYYQLFPTHNNPLVLPIIQSETQRMAAEYPQLKWDANYASALGARVNAAIAAISGQPAPAVEPAPVPGPQPAARPAAMLPSGQRAAAITPTGSISDDVVALLDPFSGG